MLNLQTSLKIRWFMLVCYHLEKEEKNHLVLYYTLKNPSDTFGNTLITLFQQFEQTINLLKVENC